MPDIYLKQLGRESSVIHQSRDPGGGAGLGHARKAERADLDTVSLSYLGDSRGEQTEDG